MLADPAASQGGGRGTDIGSCHSSGQELIYCPVVPRLYSECGSSTTDLTLVFPSGGDMIAGLVPSHSSSDLLWFLFSFSSIVLSPPPLCTSPGLLIYQPAVVTFCTSSSPEFLAPGHFREISMSFFFFGRENLKMSCECNGKSRDQSREIERSLNRRTWTVEVCVVHGSIYQAGMKKDSLSNLT